MQRTNTTLTVLSLGLFAMVAVAGAQADTITVCWDGSGDYLTIQEGIDAAVDGDEVVMCEGTYTGDGNRDLDFSNSLPEGQTRAITVRSTDPDDPEVVAATVIDCEGTSDDRHRGFRFHSGETADSVVAGLTITNGYGPAEQTGSYNVSAGGAVFCIGSSPTLTNCTFSGNTARKGGGMYNRNLSSPTLTNCRFTSNLSSMFGFGGGMFNSESSPMLTNCTFSGNTGSAGGGGMYNSNLSSPMLTNCTFSGNSVDYGGGGGMFSGSGCGPTLTNCTFSGNSGDFGGGMVNFGDYSGPTLTNCTFSGNSAGRDGGGIYFSGYLSSPTLTNCTFSGNSAGRGGGGMYNSPPSSPTLTNCILWNNSLYQIAGSSVVTHSNIQGGYPGEGNIDADPLFADPGYWDDNGTPGDPDDDVWVDGDYHLLPGSPCIDAGSNGAVPADTSDLDGDGDTTERVPLDLLGNLRFLNDPDTEDTGVPDLPDYWAVVDMGAYEFSPISLDIRPASCPNQLHCARGGMLPVAIPGTEYLDVSTIDIDTILLTRDGIEGGVVPVKASIKDRTASSDGSPWDCQDVGRDGLPDLLFKFRVRDLVESLELDELPGEESVMLTVTGTLDNGEPFAASDCVWVLPAE